MSDIWLNVDVALAEVPVNIMPLLDDTDFKTREVAIAYDAAGMDLVWNFVTTAGAFTQTAVTPTAAGNYDWAHQGDGMYTIEIPASGGASINNDTEGFGWFTGFVTGVLPWRGPVIGFRRAALNDLLINGGTASTNLEDFFDGTGYAGGTAKLDVNVATIANGAITAAAIATGAIDADAIADNAIDAGAFAADAITAAKVAADVGTEIGTAVWATVARTLTAATNVTSTGAAVPITGGGLVSSDVTAISTDTAAADNAELMFDGTGYAGGTIKLGVNLVQILGTALTETAGQIAAAFKKFFDVATPTGTVDSLPDAVPGAAGGLFIAGTNAATTVTTALTTTFTGNLTGSVGSVTGSVGSVTNAVTISAGTGAGQLDITSGVVKANLVQILGATITGTAAQLVAAFTKFFNVAAPTGTINSLPDAVPGANGGVFIAGTNAATAVTTALTANITGNLSGSVGSVTGAVGSVTGAVGSVTGAVGSVTGNVGGNVTGSIGSLATQAKADVNAQVVDALATDTYAQPGQEAPAATTTLSGMLRYLYKALRNRYTQTATEFKLYADDAVTVDQKATVSDDGTTFDRGEIGTGP